MQSQYLISPDGCAMLCENGDYAPCNTRMGKRGLSESLAEALLWIYTNAWREWREVIAQPSYSAHDCLILSLWQGVSGGVKKDCVKSEDGHIVTARTTWSLLPAGEKYTVLISGTIVLERWDYRRWSNITLDNVERTVMNDAWDLESLLLIELTT